MNEQDPDLLADDNLDELRGRNRYPAMSERYRLTEELENARYQNNLLTEKCRELQERIDAMKHEVEAKEKINSTLTSSFDALRKERDEARRDRAAYRIEIDRLILQRNDARLNVLDLLHPDVRDRYADARGWFFDNEDKP